MKKVNLILIMFAVLLLITSGVMANGETLTYKGSDYNKAITIYTPGHLGGENVIAGIYKMKIGTSGITKNMFCITPDGNISENNPYSVTLQTSGQPSGISTDTWAKVCYLANNYLDTTKYIATNDIGAAAACTIWDLMLDDNNASGVDFNKDSYADKFYTSHIDGVESARQSIWTDVSGVNSSYLDDWTMSWYQVVANGQSMIMLGENTPNDPPSVPEPATVLGLLAFAPAVISLARRRK